MPGKARRVLPGAVLAVGLACANSATAAGSVVVDFSAPRVFPAPSEHRATTASLRTALAAFGVRQPVVLGEATLRLSGAAIRRVRLIGDRDGQSGAEPWRGLYVVLDGGNGAPWAWSLPADAGNAVHGALDLDGDGVDELLLRRDSARMGVTRSDLVVWSLAKAAPQRLVEEPEVMLDRCESMVGERHRSYKRLMFRRGNDGAPLHVTASLRRSACADAPVASKPANEHR